MSDTSQGPGWWQASDGKWYPPEQYASPQPPESQWRSRRVLWVAGAALLVLVGALLVMSSRGKGVSATATASHNSQQQASTGASTSGSRSRSTASIPPVQSCSAADQVNCGDSEWSECMDIFSDSAFCSESSEDSSSEQESSSSESSSPPAAHGVDPVALLDVDYGSPLLEQALADWGCYDYYVPGPVGGSGIDCQHGGTHISIDSGLKVSSVGLLDKPELGFVTYAGELPAGLQWGMSRDDVTAALTARWGPPLNVLEGGGDVGPLEDFVTTGEAYAAMQVEFSASAQRLVGISVERDVPMKWPP